MRIGLSGSRKVQVVLEGCCSGAEVESVRKRSNKPSWKLCLSAATHASMD
jgi:hypothetical protein